MMNNMEATQTIWQATSAAPAYPPLSGDLSVDVAVVGGGITGLTTAALMAEAGRDVALLEAGRLGSGVTGCTTAHLDWSTDAGPAKLLSKFDEQAAKLTIDAGVQAIEQIAAWVERYGIDCEFKIVPGYHYTENPEHRKELDKVADAARRLGRTAERLDAAPLPFPTAGAVRYENEGRLHALRYLYGLAGSVCDHRCRIFEQTRVINVKDGSPCHVTTSHGVVHARDVVLATHSPLGLRLAIHTRVAPYRSYVIGARLAEPFPEGIFFDDADPYFYLRRFSDADDRLLLVGGADHKTGQREDTPACWRELEDYAGGRFNVTVVEYRWSAQVFVSADGLPLIGRDVGNDHIYVASGYAGNGITFGTFAGMLIADQILERDNPAATLFNPRRLKPLAAAREFISENVNVVREFIGGRIKSGGKEVAAIPQGQGALMELEGKKVAVYRDESGRVHCLNPVCPHARCMVHWNQAERSWDCPCHGSRFSATGEVLEGPAMSNLEWIEVEVKAPEKKAA